MAWLLPFLAEVSPAVLQAAVAVTVAVVAAAGGHLVTRRQTSGNVSTSNAADLWEESRAIRIELRNQVTSLEQKLEAEVGERRRLEGENRKLLERVAVLEAKVGDLDD